MSKSTTDAESENEVPIVVDAYGVKVTLKGPPGDLGEQVPSSWRDVPALVNRHLMRIAVSPTRLAAELLEGATRLVRGLTRLPSSVASRMHRAHAQADAREQQRQEIANKLTQGLLSPASLDAPSTNEPQVEDRAATAMNQIQALLQKYASQGLDAYVMQGPQGNIIIVLGTPPDSAPQVLEAIKQAQKLLNNSIEQDG